MDYNFNIIGMLVAVALLVFAIWGVWELIDWLFIDEVIKSTKPITPEIELIINNNEVDTLYIYRSK
jgi:archaellum biogenesis protein FlaJ (TadC family)